MESLEWFASNFSNRKLVLCWICEACPVTVVLRGGLGPIFLARFPNHAEFSIAIHGFWIAVVVERLIAALVDRGR